MIYRHNKHSTFKNNKLCKNITSITNILNSLKINYLFNTTIVQNLNVLASLKMTLELSQPVI